jgi:electron transport complex protein RnfC
MFKFLWRKKQQHFSGGLILEGHKQVTAIEEPELPQELIYPLFLAAARYAAACVKVGDTVLKGQVIATADGPLSTPIHAASSGIISAIEKRLIAHPSGLSENCIILQTDGLDKAIPSEPCLDYQQQSREVLREKIQQAGIVGLGGAAFPTAKKLNSPQAIHSLIINAAECEPYISCDESLAITAAKEIIQGSLIIQHILQAHHCIIAIEDSKPTAYSALLSAATSSNIQIQKVPSIYPTGGEKQLIQVISGIKIPAQKLVFEQGFICQNIGTSFAVYQAIILGLPLTERIITITGAGIKQTKNLRARIGTPIKNLIQTCQGYTEHAQQLIMGGPMMGIALRSDEIAIIKASNCLLIDTIKSQTPQPCIRCGDCATVCPAELLPQQLYWYSRAQQWDNCAEYQLADCVECGCCDVVCPSKIPLVQAFRIAKGELVHKQKQAEQAAIAKKRFENQQQRKLKIEQEKNQKLEKRKAAIEKMKAAAAKRKLN